jgi:hypothetical protein
MNGGNGWVNDTAVPLLRGAPPQVRKRDHDVSHAADIDETSEESKPARCLKWVIFDGYGRLRLDFRYTLLVTKFARHCNMSRWAMSR